MKTDDAPIVQYVAKKDRKAPHRNRKTHWMVVALHPLSSASRPNWTRISETLLRRNEARDQANILNKLNNLPLTK